MDVIPAVNEVELHPFFVQQAAIENMKSYGVVPQAWGPLAEGKHGIFISQVYWWSLCFFTYVLRKENFRGFRK